MKSKTKILRTNNIVRTFVQTKGFTLVINGFNWDEGNLDKCQKHGLSIEEVESIFENNPFVQKNTKHLQTEVRYQAVGKTQKGKFAFVVFTLRNIANNLLIRPISARYMHQKEINNYESQKGN